MWFLRVGLNPQHHALDLQLVLGGTRGQERDVLTLGPKSRVGEVGGQEAKAAGPVLFEQWRRRRE